MRILYRKNKTLNPVPSFTYNLSITVIWNLILYNLDKLLINLTLRSTKKWTLLLKPNVKVPTPSNVRYHYFNDPSL